MNTLNFNKWAHSVLNGAGFFSVCAMAKTIALFCLPLKVTNRNSMTTKQNQRMEWNVAFREYFALLVTFQLVTAVGMQRVVICVANSKQSRRCPPSPAICHIYPISRPLPKYRSLTTNLSWRPSARTILSDWSHQRIITNHRHVKIPSKSC